MNERPLYDVVREIVSKNSPAETESFDEIYEASLADPHAAAARSAPGANAFGIEIAALLTPILVSVLIDVAKDLLGSGVKAGIKRVWQRVAGPKAVAADATLAPLTGERLVMVKVELVRVLREQRYSQAEVDQICSDLELSLQTA